MSEEEIIHALKEMLRCNGIEEGGFNEVESGILKEALDLIEKQNKELEPIHKIGMPVETLVAEFDRLENLEDDREQLKQENAIYKEELGKIDKALNIEAGVNAPYRNDIIEGLKKCVTQFKEKADDSIPKSMIEDKINKLEESLWEKGYEDEKSYAIKVLKKILEGSNGI